MKPGFLVLPYGMLFFLEIQSYTNPMLRRHPRSRALAR